MRIIMAIKKEILDELMKDYKNPEDMLGPNGILHQLKRALVEKALEGEVDHHLATKRIQLRVITRATPEMVNILKLF